MRVNVWCDEMYPYYGFSARNDGKHAVPDETVARWRAVLELFEAMQDEMAEVIKGPQRLPPPEIAPAASAALRAEIAARSAGTPT